MVLFLDLLRSVGLFFDVQAVILCVDLDLDPEAAAAAAAAAAATLNRWGWPCAVACHPGATAPLDDGDKVLVRTEVHHGDVLDFGFMPNVVWLVSSPGGDLPPPPGDLRLDSNWLTFQGRRVLTY